MSTDSRSRMISFRLTTEEYNRFRELCFSQGVRSVSEMARVAINSLLEQPQHSPQDSLETRVTQLEGRFQLLSLEVKRLHQDSSQQSLKPAALNFAQTRGQ